LTASRSLGYPRPVGDPLADIVASGRASDLGEAAAGLVRAVARAAGAERAFLVRADGSAARVIAAHPAGAEPDGAPPLAASLRTEGPTIVEGGTVLVLRLQVDGGDGSRWGLHLTRGRRHPWTAADAGRVAGLAPVVELALEHALLRSGVPEVRGGPPTPAPEVIAALSHELRNPLAPILMWTATLRRMRAGDAEIERATRAIDHAVALERRLIESLVSIGRIERGLLELRAEIVDLGAVIRMQVGSHREDLAAGRVEVDATIPAEPITLRGDNTRLGEMVGHLLENAIKFSRPGGRVAIHLTRRDDLAEIRVQDSGTGVPPEMEKRLFLPFQKGPNARGGLGVGLAIVRGLAVLHGGVVEAEASSDAGATFVVRLPLRPDA
jgi:light-regulated signal transduction histidine kinase (bacteriophytochrome)